MNLSKRFEGCVIGGAIGDAFGSAYENLKEIDNDKVFYPFGKPEKQIPKWRITDDTQLTVATCEVLIENEKLETEVFAKKYLDYFKQRKITGLGASTLKAFRELEVGGHWSLVGRKGEYAAGNGAAMRIAPIAFIDGISREQIREIASITHNNDEAYIGALTVILSIQAILKGIWTGRENLIHLLIDQLPDSRVRDRLMEIEGVDSLTEIGKIGNDGYVVNSIPLAVAAANKVLDLGIEEMFRQIIEIGGDTDTNASIAGQIAGTLIGTANIPQNLMKELKDLDEFEWIYSAIKGLVRSKNWI